MAGSLPRAGRQERSQTFDRKVDAERWLAQVETDKARGQWVDPAAGRITFGVWFAEWMATTTDLRPNTRQLYEYLGRRYLVPGFGSKELAKITATTSGVGSPACVERSCARIPWPRPTASSST